ncbi:MFS transporter [Yoonia sp. BS5-3]|uniref:MFS transporter n=1 Tax=Yoonia phaeophyticola TaxID=3137369 RepID=A0ABZ2V0L1_9RHOB
MTDYAATAPARLATRLAFFTGGFASGCCAPLFPFIKAQIGADEGAFGLVLLCLGLGSIVAMPITGIVAARKGARAMILLGGLGLVICLPLLTIMTGPIGAGTLLFLFGASLGTIDVAMNIHGAEVQEREGRPLMSNFHAQFSIGGFCGAGLTTLLLSMNVSPAAAAAIGGLIGLATMLGARPRLLPVSGVEPVAFVRPRGIVLLLAALAAITFLVEGAILDWGALLVVDRQLIAVENAGIGYILFSIAMVLARLTGDQTVGIMGEFKVLIIGSVTAIAGLAAVLVFTTPIFAFGGFILIGLGAANLVPIVFSAAGRQKIMPPSLAVASVTTTGYAGILLGPALVGFVADTTSLTAAFWLLAVLFAIIPLTARFVIRA